MNQTIQQEVMVKLLTLYLSDLVVNSNSWIFKTTQVTLSMDVSYPFHSHLIGRSGQHINRLMEQTRTRYKYFGLHKVIKVILLKCVIVDVEFIFPIAIVLLDRPKVTRS